MDIALLRLQGRPQQQRITQMTSTLPQPCCFSNQASPKAGISAHRLPPGSILEIPQQQTRSHSSPCILKWPGSIFLGCQL